MTVLLLRPYAGLAAGASATFDAATEAGLVRGGMASDASGFWTYAAAVGGIVNTTAAVTIVAAAAGVRNYITQLQLSSDTLGVATEIAIRDGAAGAVLWRGKLGTEAITGVQTIPVLIRGSVNTLLEVVTLTASITGGVYINAQGYRGA